MEQKLFAIIGCDHPFGQLKHSVVNESSPIQRPGGARYTSV
jgi:hypothetical protein